MIHYSFKADLDCMNELENTTWSSQPILHRCKFILLKKQKTDRNKVTNLEARAPAEKPVFTPKCRSANATNESMKGIPKLEVLETFTCFYRLLDKFVRFLGAA